MRAQTVTDVEVDDHRWTIQQSDELLTMYPDAPVRIEGMAFEPGATYTIEDNGTGNTIDFINCTVGGQPLNTKFVGKTLRFAHHGEHNLPGQIRWTPALNIDTTASGSTLNPWRPKGYTDAAEWLSPTEPYFIDTATADSAFTIGTSTATSANWTMVIGPDPRAALRNRFRDQLNPARRNHHGNPLRANAHGTQFDKCSPQELVALRLLRAMVAPDAFRRYLKHGFVTVQGPSGLMYQVRRLQDHIVVWDQGTKLCELCVGLQDHRIPPTDAVVARMIIAECDEPDLWRRANVSRLASQHHTHPAIQTLAPAANNGPRLALVA